MNLATIYAFVAMSHFRLCLIIIVVAYFVGGNRTGKAIVIVVTDCDWGHLCLGLKIF